MGFTSTITRKMLIEDRKLHYGTFTSNSGSTGGDVDTGLRRVDVFWMQVKGSTVGNSPVVDETMPCDGNAVTIKTDANAVGQWIAIGT